jgi:hypothetical protein
LLREAAAELTAVRRTDLIRQFEENHGSQPMANEVLSVDRYSFRKSQRRTRMTIEMLVASIPIQMSNSSFLLCSKFLQVPTMLPIWGNEAFQEGQRAIWQLGSPEPRVLG